MRSGAEQPAPPPGPSRSSLGWVAGGVAVVAMLLVMLGRMIVPGSAAFSGPGIADLVAAAGGVRLTVVRPTGGFPLAALDTADPARVGAARTRLSAMATDIRLAMGKQPQAPALHAFGVVSLLLGHDADARASLQAALEHEPDDPAILSDLGAVDIQSGLTESTHATDRLRRGLELARRASELDPGLLEARFNAALALSAAGDADAATAAWRAYLAADPDSGWSDEARRRLADLGVTND